MSGAYDTGFGQAFDAKVPPGQPQPQPVDWELWAPPLNPPHDGSDGQPPGLPADAGQAIADAYWEASPHLCAALQWEAYAATLPPTPAVSSVQTGAQAVAYSPAAPTGAYGLAVQRAAWHRSFIEGELIGVPMQTGYTPLYPARSLALAGLSDPPPGWWTVGPP